MDSAPGSVGDYAASIGTTGFDETAPASVNGVTVEVPPNGAFVARKGLALVSAFKDGTSHTFLVGEKHVPDGLTRTYPWDCNLYEGHNWVCSTRSAGPGFPLASSTTDRRVVFGGPHVGLVQFVFADGGVRPVNTSVNEQVLGRLSHRNDRLPAPADY